MGHKGSMQAKYTTNKGVLPESLLNEMREAFKRCEEFLDLEAKEEDPLLKQKENVKTTIDKATPEQMQKILDFVNVSAQTTQRVATSEESEQLISQGWKFVGILPNGKVVLQR